MEPRSDKSKALFNRAERVLIERGSLASRGPVNYGDYPLFMSHVDGAYLLTSRAPVSGLIDGLTRSPSAMPTRR